MAYDEEKDVLIEDLGPIGDTGMFAEVRCYDPEEGGQNKLSVKRLVGKDKDKVRQVCRITLDEAWELGKFIVANEAALAD